jgi:hypothetical protein
MASRQKGQPRDELMELENGAATEREREWTRWTHTGGGKALPSKKPPAVHNNLYNIPFYAKQCWRTVRLPVNPTGLILLGLIRKQLGLVITSLLGAARRVCLYSEPVS